MVDIYTPPAGTNVVFDFTDATVFVPQPGTNVVFDFSPINSLAAGISRTGEISSVELTPVPASLGTITAKTGETASTDVFLDWKMTAKAGELAQCTTIAIPQQLGFINYWSGELSKVLLFSAAYQLGTLNTPTGEKDACTLTTTPPPSMTMTFKTGEVAGYSVSNGLKTTSTIPVSGQTGEVTACTLTAHPLITFSTNVMPTGEKIVNSLAAYNQFTASSKTGEATFCNLTVTGPTIVIMKTGEVVTTNLNTGFTLLAPYMMTSGESIVSTPLTVNPAWRPSLTFTTGEKNNLSTIKAFYHAVMNASAKTGEEFWAATSDQTRWIDLAYDRNPHDSFYTFWDIVYQQSGPWIIIDGYENEFPSIVHDVGINQFATAQLSVRPRFFAVASTGENAFQNLSATILNAPPGSVTTPPPIKMQQGEATKCQLEASILVPLCYGNIIPDTDHVFIEMSSPYGDGCESWWIRTGETAFIVRNGFKVFPALGRPYCRTGETANTELTLSPPWTPRARTGETIKCELWNDPSLRPVFRTGENWTPVKFQDIIITFREGAIAFIPSMHTNYDVFFDERGCLNNEFIPQTPDGDNDYANAPPITPRELDPFQHFILSHCE